MHSVSSPKKAVQSFLFRGFLIPEKRETNGKQKNGGMYNSYQTFFHFLQLNGWPVKKRHEEVIKTNIEWIDENLIEATYLFCYKKIGNSQDAEDVTQEIMLEAIKAIRKGKSFVSFYSWFWAMAKNQVNMFVKF